MFQKTGFVVDWTDAPEAGRLGATIVNPQIPQIRQKRQNHGGDMFVISDSFCHSRAIQSVRFNLCNLWTNLRATIVGLSERT